jgi:hypothetical protein
MKKFFPFCICLCSDRCLCEHWQENRQPTASSPARFMWRGRTLSLNRD